MKLNLVFTSLFAAITLSACAGNGYASSHDYGYGSSTSNNTHSVVSKTNTSIGEVFTTENGMTLYTFKKDEAGKSNCYGGCAENWPPFKAQKNAKTWGNFSVIERKDGTYQWAYNNQPLYTWVGDTKKGDTNGQGIKNVWFALPTSK